MSGCVRVSVRLSPANLVNNLIYHLNVLSCTLRALGAATYPVSFRTSGRLHPDYDYVDSADFEGGINTDKRYYCVNSRTKRWILIACYF